MNILDIGTGSGCLVISLLKERYNCIATAIDISKNALFVGLGPTFQIWNPDLYEKQKVLTIKIAKAFSFISGALCSYQANRKWTFKIKYFKLSQILSFSFLYISSLLFNVSLNSFFISIFKNQLSFEFAFIFSTTVSATYNYLGLKLFVFKRN